MKQKGLPVRQAGLAPIVLVLLMAALAVGGYLIYSRQAKFTPPQQTTQPSPSPVTTSVPNDTGVNSEPSGSAETTNWKTYTSSKLNLSFKYPSNFSYKEDTNNATQDIIDFKSGNKEFRLDRLVAEAGNEAPYNITNITKNFNEVTWKVVTPEQTTQYCDAGNCGKTAPNYYVYKKGYRYSFTYYSNDLRDLIEKILSTFKFTN